MKQNLTLIRVTGMAVMGVAMAVTTVDADEGMWLFNHPPREYRE